MFDLSRAVVVTAQHGEKYLGFIPTSEAIDGYIEKAAKERKTVILHQVRALLTQPQPMAGPGNSIIGIKMYSAIINIDMFPGPIEELHVIPSSWYYPAKNPSALERLEKLIEACEGNERRTRAMEVGLELPREH